MRVLVTGADGFVGRWLIEDLLGAGCQVIGAIRTGGSPPSGLQSRLRMRVEWIEFDLLGSDSVGQLGKRDVDGVVHLAAVASGADARRDPGYAWAVNAAGSARLAAAVAEIRGRKRSDPVVVLASTGEVYGDGKGRPWVETDPTLPCSPYAASKLGAEIAVTEIARRTGLKAIIARAFPHTGPGQSTKYVIPALADRLQTAKRIGAPVIKTGNLEPVRDYLDVRDVAAAYRCLLQQGEPGRIYNIASGTGRSLRGVVDQLVDQLDVRVVLEPDPGLARPNDISHLVGDSTRLGEDTDWIPAIPFDRTLHDLLDAQAD